MYYQVELTDVYLRKVSLRKAGVYIGHLPPESATMTAIRVATPESDIEQEMPDASESSWSSTEMLIAQMIDEMRILRYVVTCFASSKGSKVTKPEPVPRPGVVKHRGERQRYTPEQIRRLDPRLRRDRNA